MSNKKKFEVPSLHGIYYGYPLCCIQHYHQHPNDAPKEGQPFFATGFHPCPECRKKSERDVLNDIAFHRQSSVPFPQDYASGVTQYQEYNQLFFSGFLWKVMLYRSLSNKTDEEREEMIIFYAEFVRECTSSLSKFPVEEAKLYIQELSLLRVMGKTIEDCFAKHKRISQN